MDHPYPTATLQGGAALTPPYAHATTLPPAPGLMDEATKDIQGTHAVLVDAFNDLQMLHDRLFGPMGEAQASMTRPLGSGSSGLLNGSLADVREKASALASLARVLNGRI